MILTFGKFRGQDTESLKKSKGGISYLEWGSENLRDIKLRKIFADTLASITDHDHALVMEQEEGINYEEALSYLQDMRAREEENQKEYEKDHSRKEQLIQAWAKESNQPIEKIRGIVYKYMMHWENVSRQDFSSDQAYNIFVRYMNEIGY